MSQDEDRPWLMSGSVGWAMLNGSLTFGWTTHPSPFTESQTDPADGVLFDLQDYYFMFEEEHLWDSVGEVQWNAVAPELNDEVRHAIFGSWTGDGSPTARPGTQIHVGERFDIPILGDDARDFLRSVLGLSPLISGMDDHRDSSLLEADCRELTKRIAWSGDEPLTMLTQFEKRTLKGRRRQQFPMWFDQGLLALEHREVFSPPDEVLRRDVVGRARNLVGAGGLRWASDSWPPVIMAAVARTL